MQTYGPFKYGRLPWQHIQVNCWWALVGNRNLITPRTWIWSIQLSGWAHYLQRDWASLTAWRWPGYGRDYLSASCAPPLPASEARGGSFTLTRKSCIPPLPSGKPGCPPQQSHNSYDLFQYCQLFHSAIQPRDSPFLLSCQHLLQYACTSFLSHTHSFGICTHTYRYTVATCLRHTCTHARSNATVVTGFCSSFPLAETFLNNHSFIH